MGADAQRAAKPSPARAKTQSVLCDHLVHDGLGDERVSEADRVCLPVEVEDHQASVARLRHARHDAAARPVRRT